MSSRPPNRFSPQKMHNKYGIINYFRRNNINVEDVRKELMHVFCKEQLGINFTNITCDEAYAKVSQNFSSFHKFVPKYLKENNYSFKQPTK